MRPLYVDRGVRLVCIRTFPRWKSWLVRPAPPDHLQHGTVRRVPTHCGLNGLACRLRLAVLRHLELIHCISTASFHYQRSTTSRHQHASVAVLTELVPLRRAARRSVACTARTLRRACRLADCRHHKIHRSTSTGLEIMERTWVDARNRVLGVVVVQIRCATRRHADQR